MAQSDRAHLPPVLQFLSSRKIRSNNGCWTCRLRRKKCDETKPECIACKALEISCHFGDDKPDWMDAGPKQKEMAARIKAQVKKQASQRRDRKYLDLLEAGSKMNITERKGDDEDVSMDGSETGSDAIVRRAIQHGEPTPPASNPTHTPPPSQGDHWGESELSWHMQPFTRDPDDGSPEGNVHFLTVYLDYVFPYFYPFYRPPFLSGGRGWVLDVMQKKKAVYHTALSLASYFYGYMLAQNDTEPREQCIKKMAGKLQQQFEIGIKELQRDMQAINAPGTQFDPREGLSLMLGMLHMLIFEVATGNRESWRLHLDAATAMFTKVLASPDLWKETINALKSSKWPPPKYRWQQPWSTDQAALRFYAAYLFYVDVIASITLERAPRLQSYQPAVIPTCTPREYTIDAQISGPLFMDETLGLYNWAIQMMGDLAYLDAWKKQQMRDGTFVVDELLRRGKILEDALKGLIGSLEAKMQADPPYSPNERYIDFTVEGETEREDVTARPPVTINNMIWAQATLIYLQVIMRGWQPGNPETRMAVSKAKVLLQSVRKSVCLRTMVWPLCITGCMATREEEEEFRHIVGRLGSLQVFGTIKEAAEVMERVWASRDTLDESWDVAKCLNILGHGSLLI